MADYFQLIVILVAAVIVFFLLVNAWLGERRMQMTRVTDDPPYKDVDHCINDLSDSSALDIHDPCLHKLPLVEKDAPLIETPETQAVDLAPPLEDEIICINVLAKEGQFVSYDLLQAITATGMQYGAMNIFHYYESTPQGTVTLFSLASATEPGDFDLNHIGDFVCAGLILFMKIHQVPDAEEVFEIMLDTAEQLADDLQGELYAAPKTPWTDEIKQHYLHKIAQASQQHIS